MPNRIFNRLLNEQIDIFKESFSKVSEDIFKNENENQLIHPGEFGSYREAICKRFLEFIIPRKLTIDTGFLINVNNEVSTQCDLIIYDGFHTPLIQTKEFQRFFPVETVCAVGEVKSKLNFNQLNEALIKLSKVKLLAEYCKSTTAIYKSNNSKYSPQTNPRDQIITFLICQKLDFNIERLSQLYDSNIEHRLKHNMILSLDDGLVLYKLGENGMHVFPIMEKKILETRIYPKEHGKYDYFKVFANYLFEATTFATILYPEFSDYMIYPEKE
jgi:hypothetical protein